MQPEPKFTNRVQYHCAFLDCAAPITPITGDWTDWKPSAIFHHSYRYRKNSGEYECIGDNVVMTGNIGAIAEREDGGHSAAGHPSVCHMHGELYMLVRVSGLGLGLCGSDALDKLDREVGDTFVTLCIVPLPDGSLEMVVLKSYLHELRGRLSGVSVDSNYDPCEPNDEAVSRVGYDQARSEAIHLFLERVEGYTRDFWPMAAGYFSYLKNEIQRG
ncbi:hypothetical protein V491_00160 [Pseudogymnoascus sp. VKM F-3775]|nr:hypothetical protein V491_00160 [Pseudogymnoascus sp. VKM F-3775]